ncbi:MAG: hypothetical protein E6H06_14230 [Bacteroidetes bacterium]|nr:MAG: hypothetical protein E6H06_14230 [Bacteroidota bacterium]
MNKKEIDKLFVRYTSLSEAEKKNFLKNEKKRIKLLSAAENRTELRAIKNLLQDLKKEIKTFQFKG